ncbi:MAG: type II toxin-antitoxin system RelE/ParE family toxin [Bacteroidales bacterium]|jgi:phage-related protein|nr:type II toxin-antitoxin system RelE/ParE family toxin [Bacteroidales bacterium]
MRKIYWSKDYEDFFKSIDKKVQKKIDYILQVIKTKKVVHSKFVKKLVKTPYYEMRISVCKEYRVILFAADNPDFTKATEVYLLNGFIKKSSKDYKKQIAIADKITENLFNQ